MSTAESIKKDLAERKPKTIQDLIKESSKELGHALPGHMSPERLVRIALTSIRLTPGLASCTPESFLGSLFVLAQLGLEPIAGRAFLLPFFNNRKIGNEWKKIPEVQAIIGYKGLVDLFYRHEKAVMLSWGVVREKDDFEYEKGTAAFLRHRPAKTERGVTIGYWVMAELKGGGKAFEYMSATDCMAHGKDHSKTYSKTDGKFFDSSPWIKEPDAMCLKTVLIQLAKLLPLSVELQRALAVDETSRDYRRGIEDAMDIPPTNNWDKPFIEGEVEKPAEGEKA